MRSARFCGVSSPWRSRYVNFEQAQNKRRDVAIMTIPSRFYYNQSVSASLLAFSLRFSAFCPKFQRVLRLLPSGMGGNFEQAQNKLRDVSIMTLPIRFYYDQVVSTALLEFLRRFSAFCLKFQSVLGSPPSGMEV